MKLSSAVGRRRVRSVAGLSRSATALAIAAGLTLSVTAVSAAAEDGRLVGSRSVPTSSAAVQAVKGALVLQDGDADVFSRVTQVRERFQSVAGRAEFSGKMQVKLTDDARRARAEARVSQIVRERFDDFGAVVVDIPAGVDENTFAELLLATGDYEWVEPDYTVFSLATPNDPGFNSGWQHTRIRSALAWDITTGSSDVVVAIVDSGTDLDHPDLSNALVPGFNSVSNVPETSGGEVADINGHGTFCAGLAAAIGNNGTGTVGVGWNFQLMTVRASFNNAGDASLSDLQQGARWAADNGADVINVSFSGIESPSWASTGAYTKERGALIFHAAGNSSRPLGGSEYADLIVVGSTTISDNKSGFSNTGDLVTLTAPGSSVFSTRNGGGYGNSSGTSFASPIAAGVGALIYSVNDEFSAGDVQEILYMSLDDLGAPGKDDLFGRGRVNSFLAVGNAQTFVPRLESPFTDAFGSDGVDQSIWAANTGVNAASPDQFDPADGFAAEFNGGDSVATRGLRLTESNAAFPLAVSVDVAAQGIEAGESLVFEYDSGSGVWQEFFSLGGNGLDRDAAVTFRAMVPDEMLTSGTVLRVRADGADADDAWFVDNLVVDEIAKNLIQELPFLQTFEVPVEFNPDVQESSGAEVVAIPGGAPGEARALQLQGGAVIEFERVRTEDPDVFLNPADLRFDWATEGVPAGNRLHLEYEVATDVWAAVATVNADGQAGFRASETQLTVLGLGNAASFRFRADEGPGEWLVDEFFIGRSAYPAPAAPGDVGCNAGDLAAPFGVLDLGDVDAFIGAFVASDASADLTAPFGVIDLDDVDAFISAFLAGCP
ncbi:MAG: S8 family serine peptidase [Planctomycetota bacterium]